VVHNMNHSNQGSSRFEPMLVQNLNYGSSEFERGGSKTGTITGL